MHLKVARWNPKHRMRAVDTFLARPAFDRKAEEIAAALLDDIRKRGELAVLAAAARIDGVTLRPGELRVSAAEVDAAERALSAETRDRIREARDRVADFARRSMRPDWSFETPGGGRLGEVFHPIRRVGVYVPGGTAPLASTVVMTATLAQVAGVPEIVACTPCAKNKAVRPEILYAMKVCGVSEIYRLGGIQAIGLMAYGTKRVEPVLKIVGPGNAYVTAAKRQVYGRVALDLVAGPSECAVLADDSADPAWVAADLLAQAEHGSGHERALLATDSAALADAVAAEIGKQLPTLSRRQMVQRVLSAGGVLLTESETLEDAMELVNLFAPEHLELAVRDPEKWIPKATAAGAVFAGHFTPESAGDFAAGPSHVLPTGGAARMFDGLTVESFRHRTSVVRYAESDLRDALPVITRFADVEGLDAHRRAATIRFGKEAAAAAAADDFPDDDDPDPAADA
ncbi:MAG: histidinol dehydrogenase [Kiritimatiellae bacterium]|nr:histidinol dehydrogenase [Kiritimatiellia bacterium]